jgi:hypothetical protein
MNSVHKIYITILSLIVLLTVVYIANTGYTYYSTSIEERFFDPGHESLKPSGPWGHGFGIIGSLSMLLGVIMYISRKRFRSLSRLGHLKHWLEFHIFLCTLGPLLVLFHTSFKIGGLVAISFWSMVAVFLSGIIGRFIYLQIPRTIEGRELSLSEIKELQSNIKSELHDKFHIDFIVQEDVSIGEKKAAFARLKIELKEKNLAYSDYKQVVSLIKKELSLSKRIERLVTMQNLFKYWHVAHLPFAIVMLIIMIIHVVVTILFGYHWIF